jgi:hypothetical protein
LNLKKLLLWIKTLIKSFIFLPATFMHELMHFILALVTGGLNVRQEGIFIIKRFSLLPHIYENYQVQFINGSIRHFEVKNRTQLETELSRYSHEAQSISLTSYAIEFGKVRFNEVFAPFTIFVALAPFLNWVILWFLLTHFNIVSISFENSFNVDIAYHWIADTQNLWLVYIIIQLYMAGKPSYVDFDLALNAMLKPTSVILLLSSVIFLLNYFDYIRIIG